MRNVQSPTLVLLELQATAAAAEARAAREELLQQLSVAEASAAALQGEVESRDVKMAEMERQQVRGRPTLDTVPT